jgi:serine/threonine-protein kinase
MNENIKKYLPYLEVFGAFVAGVIILILLMNWLLFPSLTGSKGTVVVPDLTGKALSEAKDIISAKGLSLDKISEQYSDNLPEGIVLSQVPKPSETVKEGRNIYLTVSKGKQTVSVPYLVGKSTRSARVELMNIGLKLGKIDYESSDVYGNDTITVQRTPGKTDVPYGSNVDVVVSMGAGSQVVVPQLVGRDFNEVAKILQESKLVLGAVTYNKSESYIANTVISQTPNAGDMIRSNSPVNIVVSK